MSLNDKSLSTFIELQCTLIDMTIFLGNKRSSLITTIVNLFSYLDASHLRSSMIQDQEHLLEHFQRYNI